MNVLRKNGAKNITLILLDDKKALTQFFDNTFVLSGSIIHSRLIQQEE